mmetsp:Transcript_37497/g.37048  ORF Transcript_37497/g.37048 Transcript_37497/m.37048 type:complete len:303 (+) Transcript_37497:124-1032(+)
MMTIDELRADAMLKEKNFGDNPVIELKNYQDLQYYGPAFIGSKNQEFSMVYDTGSEWFWIPNKGCNGCPNKNAFEAASSDTFVDTGVNQELVYGQGHVTGNIGTDMIGIGKDDAAQMRFVLVDFAEDISGQKADGIAGLTPTTTLGGDLMVEKLAGEGIINANEFTVFIGKAGFDKSWIEFGKNIDDQTDVKFLNLEPLTPQDDLTYWSTPYTSLQAGDETLNLATKMTIWDTGTSLIGAKPDDVVTMAQALAKGKEIGQIPEGFLASLCDRVDDTPPLIFNFNGHEVKIEPKEFVLRSSGY